ncbi:MAG: VWA domain-containing protein [Acholeplasmataceae bacterium]|nr:VWA domain-containing protein [Acholeplasmataceae bacterium]
MKKDLVEMVFILDRSGSMSGLELDTIGGFNSMISKQKEVSGEAIVSTILFDHEFKVLHDRKSIKDIGLMTRKEYFVKGSTALLDAIGKSIVKTVNTYRTLISSEKPEKIIFIITTDGMENASCEFNSQKIKQMIEYQKEKYNWEFLFLGANIDAVGTARHYGINEDRVANYHSDKMGTEINYRVMAEAISEFRTNKSIQSNWKDEIDKDYKKRR